MKMNKTIIASIIALGMVSGSAMAADTGTNQQGQVHLFGNVTSKTCDMQGVVDGAVTDTIQLGTVSVNGTGDAKDFYLTAKDPQTCGATIGGQGTATISWSGNLTKDGIGNQDGTATDAFAYLYAADLGTNIANGQVTSDHSAVDYSTGVQDIVQGNGFHYQVALKGGNTPGAYESAIAYAVTYK
ncbi:fimbrial protein [Escherichia coli]|uniref:fimbrial protein n=1 Tax=Escherichia coli TaxID=562 RepID=UPI0038B3D540